MIMAAIDQLTSLASLISGINGKSQTTKTSGGTSTQQTNVSDQGIQQILNTILSGSGGVKSIGGRARSSGLYNSTSEDILLGNLYATAANQAELARSPTVTTTTPQTQTTKTDGPGIGGLATGLGGAFLASQALNIGAKALAPAVDAGSNYVSDLLSGLFGVSGNSGDSSKVKLGDVDFSVGGGFGGDVGSSGGSISTGEGYGLNTSTLGNFGGSSSVPGAKGFNFGFDTDTGATSVGVGGLGSIGGLLGGLVSAVTGNSGGSSGGGGSTSGGSVICTALKDQGLLDIELHAAGAKYLNAMNPITVIGYQIWGNKIADKIRDGHKGWIKVALPVATSRTALLATKGSLKDHMKYPLGTVTKFIGEPICHLIGLCVPEGKFISMLKNYHAQKGV
jgi:hypothetical protein